MTAPRILVGEGALPGQLPALLQSRAARQVLLVAGEHFMNSKIAADLVGMLGERFAGALQTPEGLLQAEKAIADARALAPDIDAVIAVGGGRTIDYAKALLYYGARKPEVFAAAPTTAGSGSDATGFAVIYEGLEKRSLEHPALLPNVVVWDEVLLEGLSPRQRAVSGLDALVQCVESLWSRRATASSRALAWEAGNWLWRHLTDLVLAPSPELNLGALYAAHYSGRAINSSRTTGAHALSYYLTAAHGIDHGHAVALLMPVFLRYNETAPAAEGYDAALELLQSTSGTEAAGRWQEFVGGLGLATTLSALGLTAAIIPEWLRHVNEERFANNPVALEPVRLAALLQQILFST